MMQDMIPGIAVTPDPGPRQYHLLATRQEWLAVMHLRGAHHYEDECPTCRLEVESDAAAGALNIWRQVAEIRGEKLADATKQLDSMTEGN